MRRQSRPKRSAESGQVGETQGSVPGVTRLGFQIPNFTYPGVAPEQLFATVRQQAVEAEASGFDTVLVMDHFYQLASLGQPGQEMIECYTLLSALAQHTSRVRLSSLVTGNTYRQPTLLAKIVTALDVVSGGRAQLGIGAGWFELEHHSLGFEFGTFTDRFERLEESLQIVLPMLRGERPTLEGKWYEVHDATNHPAPLGPIPVMIGGGGERKTLRMVAQYADESNLICGVDEIGRKLAALDEHCTTLGRDRSQITVSYQTSACIAPTHEQAVAELEAYIARQPEAEAMRHRVIVGSPDEVAEQFARLRDTGIDGVTVNAPPNGHLEGRVALLGEALAPIFIP
jgi:F420-dependent oxidoreductase-like protein